MNAADYLLEQGRSQDIAVVGAAGAITYEDLRTATRELAAALASLQLPEASAVGILAGNSHFWVAAYLAIMKAGHIAVPFATNLRVDDVRRNAQFVPCRMFFADRPGTRKIRAALGDDVVVLTDEKRTPERGSATTLSTAPATKADSDAVIMFTSGTASAPKAVRVTHRNIQANTDSILEYLALRREDRMLVILPFFYCYGASLLHTHLRIGGSLALCNTFTFPETALDMMEREGCTGFAGVPSSYQLLLRASSFRSRSIPSLRLMQQAGGKLSPVLIDELVAAKPDVSFYVMYGQTEATARLSYLPPHELQTKAGSVGRGIPGVELRVVDENANLVAPGEVGEIRARGSNISPGYLHDPGGTAERFGDGELHTGDLATVDEDGYIYVVDRKDDFIKTWGYRVSSQEIESCVLRMPELVSAAAVGVPDETAGEAIVLCVTAQPDAGITQDDVLTFCRRHLAKHMVPRNVRILQRLPLNSSGKVVKSGLRRQLTGNATTIE